MAMVANPNERAILIESASNRERSYAPKRVPSCPSEAIPREGANVEERGARGT